MSHPPTSSLRFGLLAAVFATSLLACGEGDAAGPEAGLIADEVFVSAYVELRAAALNHADREITDADRQAVLSEAGISEKDLVTFVEVHGRDVAYMRAVWDEVERQLDARKHDPKAGTPR